MWPMPHGSNYQNAIVESVNRFAMLLSAITILLLVLSAVLYIFFANRWTIGWLHLTPVALQPVWLMPATLYDYGEQLRLISLILLACALVALSIALNQSIYGKRERRPFRTWQISIRTVLLQFLFVVIAIVIARPPISEEFSRAWSLSLLGAIYTLAFAFYPTRFVR
jgi:hypothetical protein